MKIELTIEQEEQIEEQVNKSCEQNFEGMTYAEGVRATLDWITGVCEEPPFED